MDKQIAGLIKQNEAIYGSLKSKNIELLGDLAIPCSSLTQEETKEFVLRENTRLKELVKASKPPEEPKQLKVHKVQESKNLNSAQDPSNSDQEDEDKYEPPAPKYTTIGNMEDLKRAFFTSEYGQFEELVKSTSYKFYTATYKYSTDKNGAPDYSARNLLSGFVRSLDDYRKYFMVCFRCVRVSENPNTYSYPSYWIVNTNDPISFVGSSVEDFDFTELTDLEQITQLLFSMRKMDEQISGLIGEAYVH